MSIEIDYVDGHVYNGILWLNRKQVGTLQFRIGQYPKAVGKTMRLLRRLGIPIKFPAHFR